MVCLSFFVCFVLAPTPPPASKPRCDTERGGHRCHPADVGSSSLNEAVTTLFSARAAERDWERCRTLFPRTRSDPTGKNATSGPHVSVRRQSTSHVPASPERDGFHNGGLAKCRAREHRSVFQPMLPLGIKTDKIRSLRGPNVSASERPENVVGSSAITGKPNAAIHPSREYIN